jgi:hypothetical protein
MPIAARAQGMDPDQVISSIASRSIHTCFDGQRQDDDHRLDCGDIPDVEFGASTNDNFNQQRIVPGDRIKE